MIRIALVGTESKSIKIGYILDNLSDRGLIEGGLSVDYFIRLSEAYAHRAANLTQTPICSIEEAARMYKNGDIHIIVVPYGVYQYAIPILIYDGVNTEDIYSVPEEILKAEDFVNVDFESVLLPLSQNGYLHPKTLSKFDETPRFLGRKEKQCKICNAKGEYRTYLAREMMQGKKEEFEYFLCDKCSSLQIDKVPQNLGDYYSEGYYSFAVEADSDMTFERPINNMEKILDVGCGSGAWLLQKAEEGYGNLFGCDPFLSEDLRHGDRVYIRKCSIHEMTGYGTYDLIRFGDSFEHVTDPHEVLKSAYKLVKDDGKIEIKVPIYPNIAFDIFGPHWYQLDAPRHITIHSLDSFEVLAKENGLKVCGYKYESNTSQIITSLMYMSGITFNEASKEAVKLFEPYEFRRINYIAKEADKRNYGDHATIWMCKG